MELQNIKEKILNGAGELFVKFGVRSISMDDIARHLSVSKKTLYQHFVDKEDLVTQASEAHIEHSKKQYEDITVRAINAIDELAKISICMRKEMTNMNPALLFDLKKYHPNAWAAWLNHKNRFIRDSVIRNIKQGMAEGYYRSDINPEVIAAVRIEQIPIAFDERIFPRDRFSLPEVQLQIFDHFVLGLCTEKGKELYLNYKEANLQSSSTINIL
jgi:AcrR family transcriptional regulator